MGLFTNNKKYYEALPIVMPSATPDNFEKLSEKQILGAIQLYLVGTERILSDCSNIVNSTENIETFIKRYKTLLEILENWVVISNCTDRFFKGNPKNDYDNVVSKKSATQRNAIDRYLEKEYKAVYLLNTDKSRRNRYTKAIKLLMYHIDEFTDDNKEYIKDLMEKNVG